MYLFIYTYMCAYIQNVEGMRAKEVISDLCIYVYTCKYRYVFIYICVRISKMLRVCALKR